MSEFVNVFLPMRAGSERIPNKNTKSFAGINGGLCILKLEQLLQSKRIKNIIVSTNDPNVIDICNGFVSEKITILRRPEQLASSATSTDELIKYATSIMPLGHILWTHVTSPFIDAHVYDNIVKAYFENIGTHDSLMTVTKIAKFIWDDLGPINYDHGIEKWPRTQTIKPLWEVNSGAFIAHKGIYKTHMDRVGSKPYMFELNEEIAFDIDWQTEFQIAEAIFKSKNIQNSNTVASSARYKYPYTQCLSENDTLREL